MPKFFVEEAQIKEEKIIITGTDVNHISQVLRLKENAEIEVASKQENKTYKCIIEAIKSSEVICKIIKKQETTQELPFSITLYQGLPKAEKMEWIIQKCTEIGVNEFVPTILQNCVVKLDEKNAKKKIERWQKIAEAAAKQSLRDRIPLVAMPQTIKQINVQSYDAFIIAYEKEKEQTLKKVLKTLDRCNHIAVLIGPEGGLEEKEVAYFIQKGAKVITLGKRILRTETAGVVMVSNIVYEKEE